MESTNSVSKVRTLGFAGLTAMAVMMAAAGLPVQPGTAAPGAKPTGAAPTKVALPSGAQPGQPGQPGAQPEQPPAPPAPPPRQPSAAKWTDPDLEKVGTLFAGSWKSAKEVPLADGSGSSAIVMNVAPVAINGVENAMVAEIARADSLFAPYRVCVYQLYKHGGKIRLRTYELHKNPDGTDSTALKALTGFSYIPQWFPSEMTKSWLVGTLDLELSASGDGYSGKTPYPYPTAVGGATEMTSEIVLGKDSMTTTDRGLDAAGKVVWGDKDGSVTWQRTAAPVNVKSMDDGLIVIEYKKGEGKAIENGDQVAAHYSGWLGKNLKPFDSSRGRAQPLRFNQGMLIKGWNTGLIGYSKGAMVRMFIPPALAYAERARGAIPANADLFFEIEIMSVETPPPPPPPAEPKAGPGATLDAKPGGDGHDHGGEPKAEPKAAPK